VDSAYNKVDYAIDDAGTALQMKLQMAAASVGGAQPRRACVVPDADASADAQAVMSWCVLVAGGYGVVDVIGVAVGLVVIERAGQAQGLAARAGQGRAGQDGGDGGARVRRALARC
jgi:hypothetical protein